MTKRAAVIALILVLAGVTIYFYFASVRQVSQPVEPETSVVTDTNGETDNGSPSEPAPTPNQEPGGSEILKPPAPGPFNADSARNLQPTSLRVGQNTITAELRGWMFFEGEARLALYDGLDEIDIGLRPDGLPNTLISAEGEWMTTGYVPIAQTITIPAEVRGKTLVIRFIANDPRDNARPVYWGTLIRVE